MPTPRLLLSLCLLLAVTSAAAENGPLTPLEVELDAYPGLSGLAVAPDGRLWTIGETQRELVELELVAGQLRARRSLPVEGLPLDVEPEALAWMDGALYVGSESAGRHRGDPLFRLNIGPDRAEASESQRLDYRPWQLEAPGNQGIEGLCGARGYLAAAVETVLTGGDERRLAPLGLLDLEQGHWRHYLVELTSARGKLSGLACRERGYGLEIHAIERHFGVTRLIRFELPLGGPDEAEPVTLGSKLILDLTSRLTLDTNLEGIAWLDADRLVLLSDNQSGALRGRTYAFLLTLSSL